MSQTDRATVEAAEVILRHLRGIAAALELWLKEKKTT